MLFRSERGEQSRSLAIAPDGQSFVLGAEWSLSRFDAAGQRLWRNSVFGIAWGVNLSSDGSLVIVAHGDGTLRWYRASDGAELLAFFVHVPDKKWVAWTPSGYYAASPGGEDLIGWHVNGPDWGDSVGFFPASRKITRQWPAEKYAEFGKLMHQRLGADAHFRAIQRAATRWAARLPRLAIRATASRVASISLSYRSVFSIFHVETPEASRRIVAPQRRDQKSTRLNSSHT